MLLETFLNRFFVFELDVAVPGGSLGLVEDVQFGGENFSELVEKGFELGRTHVVGDVLDEDVGFGGERLDVLLESDAEAVFQDNLMVDRLSGLLGVGLLVEGDEREATGLLVDIAGDLQSENLAILG